MSENEEQNGVNSEESEKTPFPTLSLPGSSEESDDGSTELIGSMIGHYELIDVLGKGGFGIVYLAEQKQPVNRQVALKVIKPGMGSKQVIGRFEQERQALALLDHPNIAHIYDGGTTEAGLPYFVMEYVEGTPITEYCDKQKLSIKERLELFEQVCKAAQHAHQKGIIHRDIKPSNVLVSLQDDRPVPKIIDFGIAKAVSQSLTEQTFTEQGQFIGTLEYMSPEQATLTNQDIDTRSDIYSLGVLLYELLTGALPFESSMLNKAAFDERLRIIREEYPPRPSTRLSSLDEHTKKAAQNRRTEVKTLAKCLHKELEWIPLMAMRKEPDRRYKTASALADDVRNYLKGDPLTAGPESATYRLKKTIKQHRVVVSAVATVLIVLTAGIVISTSMYFQVEAEREKANQQARIAQAVNDFLNNDLLASVDPAKAQGREVTVREILNAASEKIEYKFEDEPLIEASIRTTIGETYRSLGEYEAAKPHFERAREIYRKELGDEHQNTLNSTYNLGALYGDQGRYDESKGLLESVVTISRDCLGHEHPDTEKYEKGLAWLYLKLGYNKEMSRILDALMIEDYMELQGIFDVESERYDKYEQAEDSLIEGFNKRQQELSKNHPETMLYMQSLAVLYMRQGRYDEAEPLLSSVLENSRIVYGEGHPTTLLLQTKVALLYGLEGRNDEAEQLFVAAIQKLSKKLGSEHLDVMRSKVSLSAFYMNRNQYEKSEQLLLGVLKSSSKIAGEESALVRSAMQQLCRLYKKCKRYQDAKSVASDLFDLSRKTIGYENNDTVWAIYILIDILVEEERYEEAERFLSEHIESLNTEEPETFRWLGAMYSRLGQYDDAIEAFLNAIRVKPDYVRAYGGLATVYDKLGRYDEEANAFEQVIDIKPNTVEYYCALADIYSRKLGRHTEAIEVCNRAIARKPLPIAYYHLGVIYNVLNRYDEAIEAYEKGLSLKGSSQFRASICLNLSHLYNEVGRYDEAIEICNVAMELDPTCSSRAFDSIGLTHDRTDHPIMAIEAYERAVSLDPNNEIAYIHLGATYRHIKFYDMAIKAYESAIRIEPRATSYNGLGQVYFDLGRFAEALESTKQAIEHDPNTAYYYYRLGAAYSELARYEDAIKAFKQAIQIKPDYAEAYRALGVSFGLVSRYDESVQALKDALSIQPDSVAIHYHLGIVYNKLGQYNDAISVFKQVVRLDPNNAMSYIQLGIVYGYAGRVEESVVAYKQAIRIQPANADIHLALGIAYVLLGNQESAFEEYKELEILNKEKAKQYFELIDPKNVKAYCTLGNLYQEVRRYDDAIKAYKKAIEVEPDSTYAYKIYNAVGVNYGKLQIHEEAIRAFNQAIQLNPDYLDAYNNMGKVFLEVEKWNEAIQVFTRSAHIDPDDAQAHYGLVVAYSKSGDEVSARKEYEILKTLDDQKAKELLKFIND